MSLMNRLHVFSVKVMLICQTGNTLTRFIQNKLKLINLWEAAYVQVEVQLNQVMNVHFYNCVFLS